jgi:hypothetical protein
MTEAELLASLEELARSVEPETAVPPGYWTTEHFIRTTGVSRNRYYRMIHAVGRMGRLDTKRVSQTTIDGRQSQVAAYGLLPEPKVQSGDAKDG